MHFAGRLTLGAAVALGWAGACRAGDVEVVRAWVAPSAQTGIDIPIQMAVVNRAAEADALVRLRCPFANFSEKVTTDRGGEGPPAKRPVQAIAVRAGGETALTPEGAHVMLLQTRQPLAEGERFVCAASFRKAGPLEVAVDVRRGPP
ncbi:copper chaperone PCu(A)C [Methylobacterium crusticola]|uniref:copper chaperone PCu(A)C n=1 Tax=Methylobacterium crusticola TaxID=1697972 RepID=UPI001EE1708E|nr:copper chaperone PCu(A)C [Methylobacterium crusticola]